MFQTTNQMIFNEFLYFKAQVPLSLSLFRTCSISMYSSAAPEAPEAVALTRCDHHVHTDTD
jgi:hypothetical protein